MNASAMMLYVVVIIFCFAAFRTARKFPDRPRDQIHWLGCAVIFGCLILARSFNIEEALRNSLRGTAQEFGEYSDRVSVQIPAALVVLLALIFFTILFIRRWKAAQTRAPDLSRAQLVLIARFGLLGLIPLYGLRIISLHQIDQLLYSGPLRINWMIEGAILLMVGGSAAYFAWKKNRNKLPRKIR